MAHRALALKYSDTQGSVQCRHKLGASISATHGMAPLQHKVKACNTKLPPKQASVLKQHKLETNIPIHKVQFDGVTKLDLKCYIRKTQGSVQSSTSQSPKHEQHRPKTQFSAGGGGESIEEQS